VVYSLVNAHSHVGRVAARFRGADWWGAGIQLIVWISAAFHGSTLSLSPLLEWKQMDTSCVEYCRNLFMFSSAAAVVDYWIAMDCADAVQ